MKTIIPCLLGEEAQVNKVARYLVEELEVFPFSEDLQERAEEMEIIAKFLRDLGRGME